MNIFKRIGRRIALTSRVLLRGRAALVETRTIPPISPEEVAEAKEFFPMEKFFILGHARSGTTLLVRLVRLHPDVYCSYQAHFFTHPPLLSEMAAEKRFGDWLSKRSNRWNRGVDLTPIALRAMADFILERDARRAGKTIVGDKSPNVTLKEQAVREMHAIYPDACLINIVRDGRDTLISQRFQAFIDGSPEYLTSQDRNIIQAFGRDPEPFYNGDRSVFTETSIRRMAGDWGQNVVETDKLGRELYGDHYHVLKYEDLLARPFETIAAVWNFLGVKAEGLEDTVAGEMSKNPDADWQRSKAGDLVASLEKGKRGSWRDLFTARDKRIFKEAAGEALIVWGYEKDLDW